MAHHFVWYPLKAKPQWRGPEASQTVNIWDMPSV